MNNYEKKEVSVRQKQDAQPAAAIRREIDAAMPEAFKAKAKPEDK